MYGSSSSLPRAKFRNIEETEQAKQTLKEQQFQKSVLKYQLTNTYIHTCTYMYMYRARNMYVCMYVCMQIFVN